MNNTLYQHPHTADLRRMGYGDIADAFEASGSSSESLPLTDDYRADQALERRIRAAAKSLVEAYPLGSTLRPLIEHMERSYHRRIWTHHYAP
jgi:hypothetical protein